MKKYLFISILSLLIASCDNTEDPFKDDNKAPEITVKKHLGTEFEEQFTDSLKLITGLYTFEYKIDDEETLSANITCDNETSEVTINDSEITLKPTETGNNKIDISSVDGFGVKTNTTVNIVIFDNLPPVAKVKVVESDAILSPLQRKIDASMSFDKDEKFGGKIDEYEFRIENETTTRTPDNHINKIFAQNGSYRIKVRVKDNDGVWSDTVTIRAIID
jgi:hypothetical protein